MSGASPDWVLWEEVLRNGAHWSGILQRGTTLRLQALEANANVSMTMLNSDQVLERYNMADTLKGQHTAFLRKGHVCYSDMGRVLCSVTEDTCGWHDTISGVSDRAQVAAKYGGSSFQKDRNAYHKNGQDSLLLELGKFGLGLRDLQCTINFFSKVTVTESGALQFVPGHCKQNDYIDLRFEMNVLVAISSCQHPLDPSPTYRPRAVNLVAWRSGPAPRNDMCRNLCEENQRAFYNTEVLFR